MITTTKKPAPLDYIHPESPWSEFWPNLWGHEVFGIVFIALCFALIACVLSGWKEQGYTLHLLSSAALATGLVWLLTL